MGVVKLRVYYRERYKEYVASIIKKGIQHGYSDGISKNFQYSVSE